MRVISGRARGTKINTIESTSTRPTLDRVKESLFNILQNKVIDATVLDLFAGSGALGIEALSRGAKKAVFCDKNNEACKVIKDNLNKTHLADDANVLNMEYERCIERVSNYKFDLIFIDPPYKLDMAIKAVKLIEKNDLLDNKGIIIIETDEVERDNKELDDLINENDNLMITDRRKYGRANLIFVSKRGWYYGNFYIIRYTWRFSW